MITEKRFCWWCPTSGSYSHLSSGVVDSLPDFGYLEEVVRNCELYGFTDAIIPISSHCLDPIVVTSRLGVITERLKFLIAVRPFQWNPVQFSRTLASLLIGFPGRIAVNLVEGNLAENFQEGDQLAVEDKTLRQESFLKIVNSLLKGEAVSHKGIYNLSECKLPKGLLPPNLPEIMVSGHGEQSIGLTLSHGGINLIFGCNKSRAKAFVERVKCHSDFKSQRHRVGMAMNIIARPSREEARAAAEKFISMISEKHQKRISSYNEAHPWIDGIHYEKLIEDNYWASDVLWYGIAAGKTHQRASLVGSYDDVIQELKAYMAIGIDYFVFSGYPNLEELEHVGRNIIPYLKG